MTRRIAGALAALAVAAPALAPSAAAGAAPAADPAAAPAAVRSTPRPGAPPGESDRSVRVIVENITPTAARPNSVLRISGRVAGPLRDLEDLSVRLRYSASAFSSRGFMDVYARGVPSPRFDTDPLPRTRTGIVGTRSGKARFSLSVPVDRLGLQGFGVYPLAVEVLSNGRPVARQRTFLPFVSDNNRVEATRVGWLWPLVDRPHRSIDDTFFDDELARALSPEGRLGRLLSAAAKAPSPGNGSAFPLLWSVDPALLEAAQTMADGYQLSGLAGDATEDRSPSAVAGRWLDRLRQSAGQTMLSIPYADPDVMALHRAGLDENLALAASRSEGITEGILNRQVTPDVVWPPGGWLGPDTLDTLAAMGTDTVVLNERSFPPARRLTYTPNAATSISTIGGKVNVLVADSGLTNILGTATSRPGSAALAEQRFLAETALITDEQPYQKGTLLIAPPRRWNPPQGFAAEVLADTVRVPWLRPVGYSYLMSHPSTVERGELRYPPSARRAELSQRYLAGVENAYRNLQRFARILEPRTSEFDFAILRTESSAWRTRPALSRRLRRDVRNQLSEKRAQVRIVTRGPLPLASNQGTIPVTISNGLTEHAVVVGLDVRPRNRARLDVGDIPERIRIQPEHKVTIKVRVEVATSGVADVRTQLQTLQGRDYGEPVQLKIRATGYGTAALAVTGGAFGVLVLAAVTRLILRARSGRDRPAGRRAEKAP